MGRQLWKRWLSFVGAHTFIGETNVINIHPTERVLWKMLVGAGEQRKEQLMTPVRSGECFQGSDIESFPQEFLGRGDFGGRAMSLKRAMCTDASKHPRKGHVQKPRSSLAW